MLLADLLPEVLPDVPGCPDFTAERAIRDSAIEFFDSTLTYTVNQDPEPVYAGLDVVDLEIPAQTRLVQVLRAQIGKRRLDRIARDELYHSGREWKTEVGAPVAITMETETSIRLLPIADQATGESLLIQFAVAPTRAATSIPDELGERYFREIAMGAMAQLMLMQGRSWSNLKNGVGYRQMYERAIREAKLTAAQDGVTARRQVRLRRVV